MLLPPEGSLWVPEPSAPAGRYLSSRPLAAQPGVGTEAIHPRLWLSPVCVGVSERNGTNGSWATEFLPRNTLLGPKGDRGALSRPSRARLSAEIPAAPAAAPTRAERWRAHPPSSRDRPRSHTPRPRPPPPRRLRQTCRSNFSRGGRRQEGREPGSGRRQAKGTRTKSQSPGGPGAAARAGRRRTASPPRGSTKASPRAVGGKARRDRPRAVTPGSEGQGPRPRAGAASSGVPGPGTVRASRGAGEGVRAEHVRALPRVRRPGAPCACPAPAAASRGGEGEGRARRVGKAPARIRCRAWHPPSAAGSARPVPPGAEGGPEPWALRGSATAAPPPKKRGPSLTEKKRAPHVLQRETKPQRVPAPLSSAPRSTPRTPEYSCPAGRRTHTHK